MREPVVSLVPTSLHSALLQLKKLNCHMSTMIWKNFCHNCCTSLNISKKIRFGLLVLDKEESFSVSLTLFDHCSAAGGREWRLGFGISKGTGLEDRPRETGGSDERERICGRWCGASLGNSSIRASKVDVNLGAGADCCRRNLRGPSGSTSKGSGVVGEADRERESGKEEQGKEGSADMLRSRSFGSCSLSRTASLMEKRWA